MSLRLLVVLIVFALCSSAEAQQTKKVPRIGWLVSGSLFSRREVGPVEAFQQGLRELGYVENQNIVIEHRYADGLTERLPNLAAELVQRHVDIIVAIGTPATQAAKNTTKTTPIVMLAVADPVGTGLVASLAHPGGNVTGLSNLYVDLGGKQLELLKEAFPKILRVAVIWDPANAAHVLLLGKLKVAAGALRVTLQPIEVHGPDDLEPAFAATTRKGARAFIVLGNALTADYRTRIVEFAAKNRLPAMYANPLFAEAGGLMYYGADLGDIYRRVATYVNKILKGAKPGDLPVQQPTKFEFIINLKAAKQIGLTIPQSVLYRADKVIQ